PPDMVGVQMGAKHHVDVFGCGPSRAQAFQIWRVELVETMRPWAVLVIAAAGIEQDRQIANADQTRMHAGDEAVVFGAVVMGRKQIEMAFKNAALEVGKVF